MKSILPGLLAGLWLAACSSPNLLPPNKLTPIENPLRIANVWEANVGNGVGDQFLQLQPIEHQGTGYVADYQGYLRAFDTNSGKKKWDVQTGLELTTGPVYYRNMLLFGTRQGEVVALSASHGGLVWRSQLSGEVIAPVAADHELVVARTVDGKLFGLDSDNGQRRWIYDRTVPALTLRGTSRPVITNDLVIAGFDSGRLTALALKNGAVFWETPIAVASGRTELERMIDIDADPVVVNDVVYVVTYQGRLAAVNLASGRMLWSRDVSSYTGMAVDAYRVYLSDADGQTWALNRYNGATLWRQDKLLRRSLTRPVLFGPHVIVGDYDGYLHWLSREDGRLVGRGRINAGFYLLNEDYDEDDLTFRKANNILAAPLALDDSIIAVDRQGHMTAFRVIDE